jgi:hypothetical protein
LPSIFKANLRAYVVLAWLERLPVEQLFPGTSERQTISDGGRRTALLAPALRAAKSKAEKICGGFMQDICCKLSRLAAVVVMMVCALAGSALADQPPFAGLTGGVPWQAGDIIVCFGGPGTPGYCNVLRSTSSGLVLLDQFTDFGSVTTSGTTSGTGINNTLHLLVTDAGTGSSSNIVVYTIASQDSSLNTIAHTPLHVFDGSVVSGSIVSSSTDIQAIAQDLHGNIFVGNASPPTIVKLDQFGNGISAFPIPNGALAAWTLNHTYSLGQSILDPNERLQKVTTPGTSGPNIPTFNDALGATIDGLVWTNQGTWMSGATYTQNVSTVGDTGLHLWLATIGGKAGSSSPAFTSNDNTNFIYDNPVTWTDRGAWQANTVYPTVPPNVLSPRLSNVGDTNLNLWHVTPLPSSNATGTSGPNRPSFEASDVPNAMLVDGLQWSDTGNSCATNTNNLPDWTASTPYFTSTQICESGTLQVWSVATPGTSGLNRPAFVNGAQLVPDNALTWTNQGPALWVATTQYASGTMVVDPAGHVQQVTAAGRSGATAPSAATNNPWNDSSAPNFGGKTTDGLQWTNKGSYAWQNNTAYSVFSPASPTDPHTVVVDPLGNVQHVKHAGTSTASPATAPVEPGISSGWSTNLGQDTLDNAVIWTDNNFVAFGSACISSQMNSLDLDVTGNVIYFSSGPGGVVQQVSNLSNCTVVADFGPNVVLHALRAVPPQSMPATCKGSPCPNTNGGILVVANGTIDIDAAGTSDPDETTGEAPLDICTNAAPTGNPSSCALLLDAGNGQIVARYSVTAATTPLQALTLDPFVTNCTGTLCAASWLANTSYSLGATVVDPAMHVQKVTKAGTSGGTAPIWNETVNGVTSDGSVKWTDVSGPSLANFWVGESQSKFFYQVPFGTGIPSPAFDANSTAGVCNTCATVSGIQALGIYTGKGANQAAQAKVFSGNISSATAGSPGTAASQFLSNKLNVSIYPPSNATLPSTPVALYGSVIDESTCYDDTQNFPCTQTTYVQGSNSTINPSAAIVWKIDAPVGGLTLSGDSVSSKLSGPGIGTDTDFFRDASIDDTIQVGNIDPMKCCTSSSGEPHIINKAGTAEQDFGCTIISPIAKCFQSPSSISIKMQCTSYPGGTGQFGVSSQTPWGPRLQIMQQPHPAGSVSGTCFGNAPNKANATRLGGNPGAFINPPECSNQNQLISNSNSFLTARFDTSKQNWVFNWQVPSGANNTYTATFYDDTDGTVTGTTHAASKPVISGAFVVAPKCP